MSTFRALHNKNFRLWSAGALLSNIGTWVQTTAQGWLVLTQLTHHNATALGVVTGLQFAPRLLLLPWSGNVADHVDRRRLIIATQAMMGALALALGLLTLTGLVTLWHLYGLAFLLGCVTAFDSPARQVFVSDLVGTKDLSNAVALNSASFNVSRMIGPAVAGGLIAILSTGWLFLINAASFAAVLASLFLLKSSQTVGMPVSGERVEGLAEGFRYLSRRSDLKVVLTVLFIAGTFGFNFPIFISAMAVTVFRSGAASYGILSSALAVGSVAGTLVVARRETPSLSDMLTSSMLFGVSCLGAAVLPSIVGFGIMIAVAGLSAQILTTTANSLIQLSTDPKVRGRVMAITLALALGGGAVGAPAVGRIADIAGARWAVSIGSVSGIGGALVVLAYLLRAGAERPLRDLWRRSGSAAESGNGNAPGRPGV